MALNFIRDASLEDVKREMARMVHEGSVDPEVRRLAEFAISNREDHIGAIYDTVQAYFPYIHDPVAIELLRHPRIMARSFFEGRPLGEDCLTWDTPVTIKYGNGFPQPVEIRQLLPFLGVAFYSGVDILTPQGFQPLLKVRCKKSHAIKYRLYGYADIGLTATHKAVVNENNHGAERYHIIGHSFAASNLIRVPLAHFFAMGAENDDDYDWGKVLGLFFADGSCTVDKKSGNFARWGLTNASLDELQYCQATLEKHYPDIQFVIKEYASNREGSPTLFGPRKKTLYCLNYVGQGRGPTTSWHVRKLLSDFRGQLYNIFGVKQVPPSILNGSHKAAEGFIDGAWKGDGSGNRITSANRLSSFGLQILLEKIQLWSSVMRSRGRCVTISQVRPSAKGNSLSQIRYWKEEDKLYDQLVYDVTTETGELLAGPIALSNCDGHAMLNAALLRSVGIPSRVILVDSGTGDIDHALAQAETPFGWLALDTADKVSPLGWVYPYRRVMVVG